MKTTLMSTAIGRMSGPGRAMIYLLAASLAASSLSASAAPQTSTPRALAVRAAQPAGVPAAGSSCTGPAAAQPVARTVPARAAAAPAYRAVVAPGPAAAPQVVAHDGARLTVGRDAVTQRVPIGITPLAAAELPPLDTGMTNVTTGPRSGYRFTPHPFRFTRQVTLEVPYDPALVGSTLDTRNIYTYFFDEGGDCWRPLDRVSVDEKRHVVVSRTDHFTDMVNAVVTAPDHPEGTSFNPNQIKDIQAATPAAGVNLIGAPVPGNGGDARLSYPIEVPLGRAKVQPELAVRYNSAAENGWLGLGWDLPLPAITIDTRFGVPRYDAARETETYLLDGRQLAPTVSGAAAQARAPEREFRSRVEGSFRRIVRHGDSPATYTWEITDKSGMRYRYGGNADATLTDDTGNIFQWALQEMRDPHDNVMRYHTARQADPGVSGGSVPGSNLYLKKITYTGYRDTEGPYAVTFQRDRDLREPRRGDVTIDARGGFKRVTADLLRKIDVTVGGALIRRYELTYRTGAFGKTLLKSVAQFGEDGRLFNTHTFTYHDDIRDDSGDYQAFRPLPWTSPDDNLRNGTVNAISSGAGEAGALGGNTQRSVGGHLYVGFGSSRTKSGSVGVKAGFSNATDTGLLALTDVDGDSLPDKVFRSGGGVGYRKNLSAPGGEARFADAVTPLRNLPGILAQSSDTLTVGVQGYAGGFAAQLDHVDTVTTTDRYFTDVNGDGITDLVNGRTVLFGRVGADGAPVYGVSGDTPVPIGSAPVDAEPLLGDFTADRERQADSHPLLDTLRRWVAPYDGTVRVDGPVRLVDDTSPERAAYTAADGVRVAVQHENDELWSRVIEATDHADHPTVGLDQITVKRGDRLYFRVQSRFDGAFDQVAWDPRINYRDTPQTTDVNGLDPYTYQPSRDFTLGGRAATVTVPVTGTMHLSGALVKKAATTDDVTAVVTRGDDTVFSRTIPAAEVGEAPIDVDVPVEQGQQLRWRIRIDSPVDLTQLEWAPKAEYTAARGVAKLKSADGEPLLSVEPPYEVDMYPVDSLTAPQEPFVAPATGDLIVEPALGLRPGEDQPDGRLVFTVKRRGALADKQIIDVRDGELPAGRRLTVPVRAGDELFFDVSTLDRDLAGRLTAPAARVGYDPEQLASTPATLHNAAEEGAFAQPYRGWGVAGYNGNRDRAGQPVVQGDLVIDERYRDQLPADVDPQRDREAFAADPRITPPKFVQFSPSSALRRWEAGESSWAAAGTASSSRMGGEALNLPTAAELDDATAVPRISRTEQISLTGSVGGDVGTVGGSVSSGDADGELDYLDLNGDQFPDVVGSRGVQYTEPDGRLGATRSATPDGSVRRTAVKSGNANAGSSARTITTGQGHAAPPARDSASTASTGNDMPPLGVGGNLGTGSSKAAFDLLDINGDGLPDRVYANGRAALNLGYRFAAPEPWPGGALNDGTSRNSGVNIGFETDFYGFGGGASFQQGRSSTKDSLLDVNGDGLADRVFDGSPIRVALNTGSGFAPPRPFFGSLSDINEDVNASVGAGAYFRFSVCFLLISGCVIFNPGADTSTGANRTQQALRDIDGDGFVDHLQSTRDDQLVVAQNTTGRTNLLAGVQRPMGSRIDLDYTRDGNTYDQPQSKYTLTRVAVNDGHPGDGQDVQLTTYRYDGGVWDRREREFRGYRTVVEEHRDAGNDAALYRSVTRDFRTDSHYTVGLPARERVSDGAGRVFTEKVHSYLLRDVRDPERPADPASTTAVIFPQLTRTDVRSFEGREDPGTSTFTEMAYDEVGNLTREFDAGEPGAADDRDTRMRYSQENGQCRDFHIIGTTTSTVVTAAGEVVRRQESTPDCRTGDIVRHRALLADGISAVSDFTHFDNGNVESATLPRNERGQRYRIDYTYDPQVDTHLASVKDIFGYQSSTTYNVKYGLPVVTTDLNNQRTTFRYDTVGRADTMQGPYELAEQRVTVDFEYHPEATVPYAVSRNVDRDSSGVARLDTIDTVTFTDGLQRVVQIKQDASVATGPGAVAVDAMTVSGRVVYDFAGRAVEEKYPTSEPKGAANTTFNRTADTVAPARVTLDVLDRPLRTVLPDGATTTLGYGFAAEKSGATRLESVTTDPNGHVKRAYTDVRGQVTAVREANPAGGQPSIWTSYGYDPLGQLTSVKDDKNTTTTMAYDHFGRRTLLDSPDTGRTRSAYDTANNLISSTTAVLGAQGQSIRYDYDFNRLVAVRYPVFARNNVSYQYGAPGAAGNTANRVTRVTDAAGTTDREYGPLGETVRETRTVAGVRGHNLAYTTRYRFDSFNRVLQMTYPDGEVLSYRYNSGGLVSGATGTKGRFSYPYLKRLDYDKFGQRVLLEPGNGTQTRYSYDALDRRLSLLRATASNGKEFQKQSYGYDEVGNVTSIENDVAARTSAALTDSSLGGPTKQTFEYDGLNRLTASAGEYRPDKDKVDKYALTMAYDSVNNVTAKQQKHERGNAPATVQPVAAGVAQTGAVTVPATTYSYDYAYDGAQPHAPDTVGGQAMRYDANGNLIARDEPAPVSHRRQLIWDEENRLACTTEAGLTDPIRAQQPAACDLPTAKVRFTYDDQGNRVIKQSGSGGVNIYPNRNYSQRDLTAFKHVFVGDDRLVSKRVESGASVENEQFYFHADHLGSTGYGSDKAGKIVDHQQYFPSGETWVDETRDEPTPYQFTGKELDAETGLYYYGARYYDPRTTLWQSTDPAMGDYFDGAGNGGVVNPANLNPYSYGLQNPVGYADPDGRQAVAAAAVGGYGLRTLVVVGGRVVLGTVAAITCSAWCVVGGLALGVGIGVAYLYSGSSAKVAPPSDGSILHQEESAEEAAAPAAGQAEEPGRSKPRNRNEQGQFAPEEKSDTDKPKRSAAEVRAAWKALAEDLTNDLTPEERQQIKDRGWKGPKRNNPWTGKEESKTMSHEPVPHRDGGKDMVPRWPDDHAAKDPDYKLEGNRIPHTNLYPPKK